MTSRVMRQLGTAFALVVLLVCSVVLVRSALHRQTTAATPDTSPAAANDTSNTSVGTAAAGGDALGSDIERLQTELRRVPQDYVDWAALGLDYVQQAKITVNPAYYPKAEAVLHRSLSIHPADNYLAMAGMSSLKSAEHDFAAARSWALRGLRIDSYSALLWGAVNDADTQLGRYPEAFHAVRRMDQLQPAVPSATRLEYMYELRGDLSRARAEMGQALAEADNAADKAFAHYYLGELAWGAGDPETALQQANAGLAADPNYSALLEGKAKAEAALGRTAAALRDYRTVVSEVPQPQYVVEYGELLQSVGRTAEARRQYQLFATENKLFRANHVTLDTDPTLFYADHGKPTLALEYGTVGIRIRPFVEMDDAYAWALHANDRDAEALVWEQKAMALGTRNALFYYHAGMIEKALGRPAKAREQLRQALAINPHFNPLQAPTARSALSQLGGAS